MLRGLLLVLLSLYAVLPPGIYACRLDALLWASLTEKRPPDCMNDEHEHDHHCPGAKKVFVPCDRTCPPEPGSSAPLPVYDDAPAAVRLDGLAVAFALDDFARPPLILTLCALRI
jgi:hypothetical protein